MSRRRRGRGPAHAAPATASPAGPAAATRPAAPREPTTPASSDALLEVTDLHTHICVGRRSLLTPPTVIRAVDGVTFSIRRGQTFGIVGESGCGKTTLARTILRLVPATSGSVRFLGRDVLALRGPALRGMRRQMQIVFQDPAGSLNPRRTVDWLIGEALVVHGLVRGAGERRARVAELLGRVGLSPDDLDRYPHEFSGGQRQRIGIARALALHPALLVLDEPVSALDVSIQSQILNLLVDLQERDGLSYLFIAHNLSVVRHFCDEIAVMRSGRIIEQQPAARLFEDPQHDYTKSLLAAAPRLPRCAAAGGIRR